MCFATLQQNELNSDVARFTTHVRTCIATNMAPSFFFVMINRATSLFNSFAATLQNKLHVLCCPFYYTLSTFDTYPRRPTVTQFRSRQSYGKIEDCKQSSLGLGFFFACIDGMWHSGASTFFSSITARILSAMLGSLVIRTRKPPPPAPVKVCPETIRKLLSEKPSG